jgi:hypothetical protein
MAEQVKTVFVPLRKVFCRGDPEAVKKCMTASAYKMIKKEKQHRRPIRLIIF